MRWAGWLLGAILVTGAQAQMPLPRPDPRPRPVFSAGEAPLPRPDPRPRPPVEAPQAETPSACFLRLTASGGFAQAMPPIVGPGECGAEDVVTLHAIMLPERGRVAVTPPAILRCSTAEMFVRWVREDLSPAAAGLGAPLVAIDNFDSYECRGRNRVVGAQVSEHGHANAIDVRALVLGDKRHIDLTDTTVPKDFRIGIRASACARFTTVLGPGSDGYHENHIHVDLAQRHRGYRICQWDVRSPDDVPLPRPRPPEASGAL
jgi:hypothetical protein